MDEKELKQILATKAPAYQRSLVEIPKDGFVPRYSSSVINQLVNLG